MDYVYCGNEPSGRPEDIITLSSIFLIFIHFCLVMVKSIYNEHELCLDVFHLQCTMHRMAMKRIQLMTISQHSALVRVSPSTLKWEPFWPMGEKLLVCLPFDLIRMKNCFGWATKGVTLHPIILEQCKSTHHFKCMQAKWFATF